MYVCMYVVFRLPVLLNAVRINAHSLAITARSSAAVLHARTLRINSRSFIDMVTEGKGQTEGGREGGAKEGESGKVGKGQPTKPTKGAHEAEKSPQKQHA